MTRPLVSIVVETVTARVDHEGEPLGEIIAGPIASLGRQTWPKDRIELILVVDDQVSPEERQQIASRHPDAKIVPCPAKNYFAAKNTGAAAATGEFVLFLDGDCTAAPDCVEKLVGRFEPDIAAVVGRVRYAGSSWASRTFSVPDFAYILAERDGQASGVNLSCAAFRRSVLAANPLEERIARNGGCYLLFHRLRQAGARMVYEPGALALHRLDFAGLGFFGKHFGRGYDNISVLRADSTDSFRGTRWYRRFGSLALVALSARRILVDWARLARHRRQIGISAVSLPYFALVAAGLRTVELAGALSAQLRSKRSIGAGSQLR